MNTVSPVAPEPVTRSRRVAVRKRVGWRPRLSVTHGVMVAAGLLAFIAVLAVLRDRGAVLEIPLVTDHIATGEAIDPAKVSFVVAHGPADDLAAAVLSREEFDAGAEAGVVAARDLSPGTLVSAVDVVSNGRRSAVRIMSVPVAASDAIARSLVRGDVVDIIAVIDDSASFVAAGVEVVHAVSVERSPTGAAAIGLALDGDAALRIAWALSRSDLRFLRATGAAPVDSDAIFPHVEAAPGE